MVLPLFMYIGAGALTTALAAHPLNQVLHPDDDEEEEPNIDDENDTCSLSFEDLEPQHSPFSSCNTSPLSPLRPAPTTNIKLFDLAREQKWPALHHACQNLLFAYKHPDNSTACLPSFLPRPPPRREKDTINALYESLQHDPPPYVIRSLLSLSPHAVSFQKNTTRSTPLHVACYAGASPSIIKILIQASPDAILRMNRIGWTPLHLLCWGTDEENVTPRRSPAKECEIARLLLEPPVGTGFFFHPDRAVHIQDRIGWTPLHLACWGSASVELISYLLRQKNGLAARLKTKDDWTPLHLCCRYNASLEVMRLLLEAYPKAVGVKARGGWTPLHLACWWSSSPDVIRLLLSYDVSVVHRRGWEGHTPLEILARRFLESALMMKSLENDKTPRLEDIITNDFWDKVCLLLHAGRSGNILEETCESSLLPTIYAAAAMMDEKIVCPNAIRAMVFYRISSMTRDKIEKQGNVLMVAIENGVGWNGGLELIFRRYPETVYMKKKGLLPFMVAGLMGDIDGAYELLKCAPELVGMW